MDSDLVAEHNGAGAWRNSIRRALVAGLLIGFCLAVSMKATVSLLSLLISAPLAVALGGRQKPLEWWLQLFWCAAALLFLAALIPGSIMIFFALKGLWSDFRYHVFDYNFLGAVLWKQELSYKNSPASAAIILAILLLVVIYSARRIARRTDDPQLAIRRAFIFLICFSYPITERIWLSASRTYGAIDPLVFILFIPAMLALSDWLALHSRHLFRILRFTPLPGFIALAELSILPMAWPRDRDHSSMEADLVRQVLRLTDRNDYVLDCKGETVFRRRCSHPVLEWITRKRIERGLMMDDAPWRCVERRTCVAATISMHRFSDNTRQFLERNYLPVTKTLRVAGEALSPSKADSHRFDFEVVIPATYEIISPDRNVSGTLDGMAYFGKRFLAPGPHTFQSVSTSRKLVLLWAQAADRHFTPFGDNGLPDG